MAAVLKTMMVRLLRSRTGAVGLINESDFDPAIHAPVEQGGEVRDAAPVDQAPVVSADLPVQTADRTDPRNRGRRR